MCIYEYVYVTAYCIYSTNELPQILRHKFFFYHILHLINDPLTSGYASLQKYFFNIQWHQEKTFKHLFILKKKPNCNTIKIKATP